MNIQTDDVGLHLRKHPLEFVDGSSNNHLDMRESVSRTPSC